MKRELIDINEVRGVTVMRLLGIPECVVIEKFPCVRCHLGRMLYRSSLVQSLMYGNMPARRES